MEMTAVVQRYRRVIIHHGAAWRPGEFCYATDIELLDAEMIPTATYGLVQVRGTEVVYECLPLPDDTYHYTEYHRIPRFPFIRREKKSMPMQKAVKTRRVDAFLTPVRLKWQKTGTRPFAATLPATKIDATD